MVGELLIWPRRKLPQWLQLPVGVCMDGGRWRTMVGWDDWGSVLRVLFILCTEWCLTYLFSMLFFLCRFVDLTVYLAEE